MNAKDLRQKKIKMNSPMMSLLRRNGFLNYLLLFVILKHILTV